MPIDEAIRERIEVIGMEVMTLVADRSLSLTEKNRRMRPLADEKKVLETTLHELKAIEKRDYSGRCLG